MEHKTTTRVFRDRNELEIIQAVVAGWKQSIPALAATFDLVIDGGLAGRLLPRRQFTMQHNESDADFIRRLMQRRGIAWHFRPGTKGATGDPGDARADGIGHTLVLFRDSGWLHRNAAGSVRLHRDDATEQRDHGASALNLGYLTTPRRQDDARPRGEGAELRTDEAIALRAARGILLSTWKLLGGAADETGQLARADYLQLLAECKALCTSLGDYAAGHAAMAIDTSEQEALLARFRQWDDGSNTAPDAAPRKPVIAVTSPSGIGFASSKAIVSYSASTIDTAAGQHLQFTAGQRYAVNAGDGVSLFARGGGLSAIAHADKRLLQSQRDDIAVNSAKDIQVSASNGAITVTAKSILFVTEDGSFFKLGDGAPVLGSKQALKFHAPDFLWDGPETMSAQLPLFESAGTDLAFEPRLYPHLDGGVAAEGLAYRIESAAGASAGTTGADGATTVLNHEQMHVAHIRLEENGQ